MRKTEYAGIVDELTYRCYAYNRRVSPDVTPERWALLFGAATAAMEARFVAESGK